MANVSATAQCLVMIILLVLGLQLAMAVTLTSIDKVSNEIAIEGGGGQQREFDYFILALQWPGTACDHTSHCCPTNGCCRRSAARTEFTIHGLWPEYNDNKWPSCCSKSSFDEKEISTLLDAIQKYWPSYSCGSPSTCHGGKGSFWAHEWEKHGTCSNPVFHDEYSYFLASINLYFKYNVTNVLNAEGYVPSNTEKYPLGGIISAIQNAFHETPKVSCSGGAVKELWLCFEKNFQPRDCVKPSSQELNYSKSSCPKYVSLPIYEPKGLDFFAEVADA